MRSDTIVRTVVITIFLVLSLLAVIYAGGSIDPKGLWDYLSYALPCGAGVFAGAGFYFGRSGRNAQQELPPPDGSDDKSGEKFFYVCSVAALVGGLFFYVLAHRCSVPALVVLSTAVITLILVVLAVAVKDDLTSNSWIGGLTLTLLAALVASLLVWWLADLDLFYFTVGGKHYCVE